LHDEGSTVTRYVGTGCRQYALTSFLLVRFSFFFPRRGPGDLHSPEFDDYAQSVVLNEPGNHSISSPRYTLTAYPNEDFFAIYETNNPVIATIGAVCIIVFTSVLFFLYDFLVRTEFNHKESISRARGQFVRFISHEVRIPTHYSPDHTLFSFVSSQISFYLSKLYFEGTNSAKCRVYGVAVTAR